MNNSKSETKFFNKLIRTTEEKLVLSKPEMIVEAEDDGFQNLSDTAQQYFLEIFSKYKVGFGFNLTFNLHFSIVLVTRGLVTHHL